MGKKIKLTEQELRNTINTIVKRVLSESVQQDINKLDDSFSAGLSQIADLYNSLKGFVREYGSFVTSLMDVTKGLGLQLTNSNVFNKFDLRTALKGSDYVFDFNFIFPGADTESMDDDEYDAFESKMENIRRQVEYLIGKPEYGNVNITISETGLIVSYIFKLI